MPSGWYRFFWMEKNFHVAYNSRNRAIAVACFILLLAIFVLFQFPGSAGFFFHPVSLFFLVLVEIFLVVLITLADSFVFDFKNRKVSHDFGFLGIVKKRSIKFGDIARIEVRQVVRESFLDALQSESRRKLKKYYQMNFTTRSGVNYQIGIFDETAFRTLLRVSEDVKAGTK